MQVRWSATGAGRRQRVDSRWVRRLVGLLAGVAMVVSATASVASTAVAATAGTATTALDVSFGGTWRQDNTYGISSAELNSGTLSRVTGQEASGASGGVTLAGGTQGVHWQPPTSWGTTAVTQGFVSELTFTPTAAEPEFGTLFAVDGNFSVRYRAGQLQYGFTYIDPSGNYVDDFQTTPLPSAGVAHTIGLGYDTSGSSPSLSVYLDGVALTPITAPYGSAVESRSVATVGIGNDVHPAALSRGFVGSIGRVRISTLDGAFSPSMLVVAPAVYTTTNLSVVGQGTVTNGVYSVGPGETNTGALSVQKTTLDTPGVFHVGSGGKVAWSTTDKTDPFASGLFGEVSVSPAAIASGATLIDLYGAVQLVAVDADHVKVTAGTQSQVYTLPAAQQSGFSFHDLGLAVTNDSGSWQATLVADGADIGTALSLSTAPTAAGTQIRWLAGATGDAYGFATSTFTGPAGPKLAMLTGGPCVATSFAPAPSISVLPGSCLSTLRSAAASVVPDANQLAWQRLGVTAIIHFGVNTFSGREIGTGQEDPDSFDPSDMNTDQWAKTLADDGFTEAVFVAKHHDGFGLWPSRYGGYNVSDSSWDGGKGDVVGAITASLHKYGIKVGIYVSPADLHQYDNGAGIYANGSQPTTRTIPTLVPGDSRAQDVADGKLPTFTYSLDDYNALYLNQLYELLTQYGEVDEVWLDGANPTGKPEPYNFYDWFQMIHALQPHAVVFQGDPASNGVRWVGNEDGVADPNEQWSPVLESPSTSEIAPGATTAATDSALAQGAAAAGVSWYPAESDTPIYNSWFWHPTSTVKSPATLLQTYNQSYGRNTNLLLGIAPDTTGQLPSDEISSLNGMADLVRRTYPGDIALHASVTATGGVSGSDPDAVTDGDLDTGWHAAAAGSGAVTLTLPKAVSADSMKLSELIQSGQRISGATVSALVGGSWQQIATVGTIGAQRIVSFSQPVTAAQWRVSITGSRGPAALAEVDLYRSVAADAALPTAPKISAISPANGATLSTVSTVSAKVSATDGTPLLSSWIELQQDGKVLADSRGDAKSTASAPSLVVDPAKYGKGVYTLQFFGLSSSGALAQQTVSIRLDASGPVTPPKGPSVRFLTPTSPATVSGSVPVSVQVGGKAIGTYRLTVDGARLQYLTHPRPGALLYRWNTRTVRDGRHTLSATATTPTGGTTTVSLKVTVANAHKRSASIGLTVSPAKVTVGRRATARIDVHVTHGTASGTIRVFDGSTVIAHGRIRHGELVVLLPAGLTLGRHTLWAAYSGSASDLAAISANRTLTVIATRHR